MTALLIDILDATGNRLGSGPVEVATAATVTRVLDGCGSVTVNLLEGDARVTSLIAPKRRAVVYADDGESMREIGRFVVEKSGSQESAGTFIRTIDGPSIECELKHKTVRRGRKFDNQTVSAIVDSLLALVPGTWARSGVDASTVSARFDGASVLKCLVELTRQQGIHFRYASPNTIEIGAFGEDCGLIVENAAGHLADPPDHVMLISQLTLLEDSEELINWLEPIGAGDGDAALTLEHSTRSIANGDPYGIETETGPDGRTVYFIQDSASQTAYGLVEKTGAFRDITPVGTSAADIEAAANALYDAAAATLARFSEPYVSYSLSAVNVKQTVQPGDKIRLSDHFTVIDRNGEFVDVRAIDDYFWVIQSAEQISAAGHSVQLQIANIDRHTVDEAEIVVGAIEDIRIANTSTKPYFSHWGFTDAFEIDASNPATFQLNLTARTQAVNIATLRILTTPFTATAAGAASGGGSTETTTGTAHSHVEAVIDSSYGGGFTTRQYRARDSAGTGYVYFQLPTSASDSLRSFNESPDHTHNVTIPAHTHTLTYGLQQDSDYPDHISVTVDGQTVASDLDTAGTGLDTTLDITDALNAGTLQTLHEIEIACTGGQGRVKALLEIWETVQSVSVYT